MVDIHDIQDKLWAAADELRANSRLKASEYSIPVLGLIFLRYADGRFTEAEAEGKGTGRREIGREAYQARGVLYLPPEARFSYLLDLPEGADIGKALNDAMKAIEADNEDLKYALPQARQPPPGGILATFLVSMWISSPGWSFS
jgi:type I restriction enzyme M protein